LQHVRLQRLNDRVEKRVVGINRESYLLRASLHLRTEYSCEVQGHVSGRRREKDKTHHIGAALNRRIDRLGRRQATDFDRKRHLTANIRGTVREGALLHLAFKLVLSERSDG